MSRRVVLTLVGVSLVAAMFLMANAVDRGLTRALSDAARLAWAIGIIFAMLVGIWTALRGRPAIVGAAA